MYIIFIYYIYREQWYKSLLSFNKENIFENVSLLVVSINIAINKVVKLKISSFISHY